MQSTFSSHSGMKLEIHNKENHGDSLRSRVVTGGQMQRPWL